MKMFFTFLKITAEFTSKNSSTVTWWDSTPPQITSNVAPTVIISRAMSLTNSGYSAVIMRLPPMEPGAPQEEEEK